MNKNSDRTLIFLGRGSSPEHFKITNSYFITASLSDESKITKDQGMNIHRYAQDLSSKIIIKNCENWLQTWSTTKIYHGQNIDQFLNYNKISLWSFVYEGLWDSGRGLFEAIYYLETIRSIIENKKPSKVIIDGEFDYPIYQILEKLSESNRFSFENKSQHIQNSIASTRFSSEGNMLLIFRMIISKIFSRFYNISSKNKITVFLNHGIYSTVSPTDNDGDFLINDIYFEGLESYFAKNSKKISMISISMPRYGGLCRDIIRDISQIIKGKYIPWVYYHSIRKSFRKKNRIHYFYNKLSMLENEEDFRNSFIIDGFNVYPLIRNVFKNILPRKIALAENAINICKNFVSNSQPRLIFNSTGIDTIGKALSFAANEKGIRIVSLQRGLTSATLPMSANFFIPPSFDKRMLPEFLVWGEFYKRLLISHGYPSDLIHEVGFCRNERKKHPTTDGDYILYIANANKNTATYFLSLDEEIQTIEKILKLLPQSLKMVIKLHPSHVLEDYHRFSHNSRIRIVTGTKSEELYELINNSILVIAKSSVVLVQAKLLGKPIISVNFSSNMDFLGLINIPFISSEAELSKCITSIIDDKIPINDDIKDWCSDTGNKAVSNIINKIEH